MKQRTLFGTVAKEKPYFAYKSPTGDYECFIERYCLRKEKQEKKKCDLLKEAQGAWGKVKKDEQQIKKFLELQQGEKPFVRYALIFPFIFSNIYIENIEIFHFHVFCKLFTRINKIFSLFLFNIFLYFFQM